MGARFDGWTEYFNFATWQAALAAENVDTATYLSERDPEVDLPWVTVDPGVDLAFLKRDWRRAQDGRVLPDCRIEGPCYDCSSCSGDLLHVFAKLEAMGDVPARTGPAIPSHGRGEVALKDDPRPVTLLPEKVAVNDDMTFDPRNADPSDPAQELRKWQIWRNQAATKCWYRIEFKKSGDMAFLGHLDFQRQLHLALRRSGLPAAYSRGYHPHPLLKFGPPLPVGVVGLRECLDIAMEFQVPGWIDEINRTLPTGLRIHRSVVVGGQTPQSIDHAVTRFDYRVEVPGTDEGGLASAEVAAAVDAFLASESWMYLKKRPKGDIKIDARALVMTGGIELENPTADGGATGLCFSLMRSPSGATLSVHDFLTALLGDSMAEIGHCHATRTGYYGRHVDGRWLSPIEEVGESDLRYWLGRRLLA